MFKRKSPEERVYNEAKRVAKSYQMFLNVVRGGVRLGRIAGLQPGQTQALFEQAELPPELVEAAVEEVYGGDDPL
jgi:hypothetical protein